jgi:hypothetical protein
MYCVNNDTINKVKVNYIVQSIAWLNGKHGKLTEVFNFRKVNTKTKSCFQLFVQLLTLRPTVHALAYIVINMQYVVFS